MHTHIRLPELENFHFYKSLQLNINLLCQKIFEFLKQG